MIALGQDVKTDYDKGVDLSQYHTYAWHSGRGVGQYRLLNNSLVSDRIRASISEDLAAKGLRNDQSNPDLYVHCYLGATDRQEVRLWRGWLVRPRF